MYESDIGITFWRSATSYFAIIKIFHSHHNLIIYDDCSKINIILFVFIYFLVIFDDIESS